MYNRRYDKKFLMLRQEHTGYSFGNKTPWGSCIIEIKNNVGELQVKVQGLQKTKYDVYFIGKTGLQTKSIFCQTLSIDKQGQGEFLWEFSPDAISNLPISIEEIHTIAILVANEPSIIAPLVAYTKDTINWRTHFQIQEKTPPKQTQQSAPKNKNQQEKIPPIHIPTLSETVIPDNPKTTEQLHQLQKDLSQFECTEESILSASESIATIPEVAPELTFDTSIFQQSYEDSNTQNYHGNFKHLIQKFHNELDILKKEGIFEESDLQKIKEAGEQSTQHFKKTTDEFLQELNDSTPISPTNTTPKFEKIIHILEPKKNISLSKNAPPEKETLKTDSSTESKQKEIPQKEMPLPNTTPAISLLSPYFSQHTKVTPFSSDEIWTCITLEEIVLLPMFPLSWQTELFFIYPMKSYQHLLYREEHGVYFLAVPCRKDEKELESSDASFFGFHNFQPMNHSDFGYWIREAKSV